MDFKLPRVSLKPLLAYMLIFAFVPTLTYGIGKWVDSTFSLPVFIFFPLNLFLGLSMFFIGLTIGIKATRTLYKVGGGLPWGGVNNDVRSGRLVTEGLYSYTRNPMMLGYSLLPFGMGIMFRSLGMTLSITPVVLLINFLIVKKFEEPSLERRFGEKYRDYKEKTPFLIPRDKGFLRSLIGNASLKQDKTKSLLEQD
jgi:protein-S-isoprenylcysteine O-methyltransferase Ste14